MYSQRDPVNHSPRLENFNSQGRHVLLSGDIFPLRFYIREYSRNYFQGDPNVLKPGSRSDMRAKRSLRPSIYHAPTTLAFVVAMNRLAV
jgi:hypothetical protein